MKTNVASSSIDAYADIKSDGTELSQFDRILNHMKGSKLIAQYGVTRKEISEAIGIEASDVGGRCNAMVHDGRLEEDPLEKRKCAVSKKRVKVVRLPSGTEHQKSLFSH